MPIHDRGYQRYTGVRLAPGAAWRVIALDGIRRALGERRFIVLLVTAWGPFVIRTVQTYLAAAFPQAAFLAPTALTYREFLSQQGVFVFLVTVYTGAGLIATDRRTQALPLYLSKPLRPADYMAGKLAIILTFLAGVSLLPALLLLVVQALISGDLALLRANPHVLPAITLLAALQMLVAATTMLALSSLARSGRVAGMVYAAVTIGSAALVPVVRTIAGPDAPVWLAPLTAVEQVGDRMFGVPGAESLPWPAALLTIALVVATSMAVLRKRVRGVEVVA